METDKAPTRRDRRIAARRAQILAGAAKVFMEKGFSHATTKDIAEAADVAEGTIYNYFDNKDHLLIALIEQAGALAERQAMLDQSLAINLREFVTSYFSQRLKDLDELYPVFMVALPEILNNPHLREHYQEFLDAAMVMMERHLRQRLERGQIEPLDIPLVTRLVTALILGMQVLLVLDDPIMTEAWKNPDHLMETMAHLLLDGAGKKS